MLAKVKQPFHRDSDEFRLLILEEAGAVGRDKLRFRNKIAWLDGCTCSSGKASRACPVACVREDAGCVVGETIAGSMVGGVEIVTDERADVD